MTIKNLTKLVAGVGINDADYQLSVSVKVGNRYLKTWRCPLFSLWYNMITRCYSVKNTSYVDCYVIDEWLTFSKFKKWVDTQPIKNWQECNLDKDLLFEGNKKYSPETCHFVSPQINKFLQNAFVNKVEGGVRGCYLDKRSGKYTAQCSNPFSKKTEHLGCFSDKNQAYLAWRKRKHELALILVAGETDPVVIKALSEKFA